MEFKTDALVIKATDYKENDKLLIPGKAYKLR